MIKLKHLIVFTISFLFVTVSFASRIHVVNDTVPSVAQAISAHSCRPITLKNRSDETLYVNIRYIDDGMDDWYLEPSQVVEVDMDNNAGDCDKGAFIRIETLDHYQIFNDYVEAGRKVVIDPYQLKYLRG